HRARWPNGLRLAFYLPHRGGIAMQASKPVSRVGNGGVTMPTQRPRLTIRIPDLGITFQAHHGRLWRTVQRPIRLPRPYQSQLREIARLDGGDNYSSCGDYRVKTWGSDSYRVEVR